MKFDLNKNNYINNLNKIKKNYLNKIDKTK